MLLRTSTKLGKISVLILVKERDVSREEARSLDQDDLAYDNEIEPTDETQITGVVQQMIGTSVDLSSFPWEDLLLKQNEIAVTVNQTSTIVNNSYDVHQILRSNDLERDITILLWDLFAEGKQGSRRLDESTIIPEKLAAVKISDPIALNELKTKIDELLAKIPLSKPVDCLEKDWRKVLMFQERYKALKTKLDAALVAHITPDNALKGGIDMTASNLHVQTKTSGLAIKFRIDTAMISQLQKSTGFIPTIISMRPLTDLGEFLGVSN